jgi:hypothetical protein
MPENLSNRNEARRNGGPIERRRFARKPVPEVFVAVELSDTLADTLSAGVSDTPGALAWAGSAIDISPGGLGLTLPEDIPVGSEVLLTFWLDDATVFSRVPSVVVRKEHGFGLGAVRFHDWSNQDVSALWAYLQAA